MPAFRSLGDLLNTCHILTAGKSSWEQVEQKNRTESDRWEKEKGEKKEAMEELCAVEASRTWATSIQLTSKSAKSPDSINLQIKIIIYIWNFIHLEKKNPLI